jgi:Pyruvate/2-oxoacid:ferredoxin oxidoreductase delta subunit
MTKNKKVIFCQCKYARVIPKETKSAVEKALNESNIEYTSVDDLCDLSVHDPEKLRELKADDNIEVIACYHRAVKGIFRNAKIDLDDTNTVHNMRDQSPQTILKNLGIEEASNKLPTQTTSVPTSIEVKDPNWKPWFPVIDYDRCTNCLQCMTFCLFGVYGVDKKEEIDVAKPQNCKTDCPACSRVCPEVAIMFPKYKNSPMNGAPVDEKALQKETVKVDISDLLGGDIYDTLRERRRIAKSRFSKERDESKAAKERKRCLKELQDKLEISDELVNSLSPEEKKFIGIPTKETITEDNHE